MLSSSPDQDEESFNASSRFCFFLLDTPCDRVLAHHHKSPHLSNLTRKRWLAITRLHCCQDASNHELPSRTPPLYLSSSQFPCFQNNPPCTSTKPSASTRALQSDRVSPFSISVILPFQHVCAQLGHVYQPSECLHPLNSSALQSSDASTHAICRITGSPSHRSSALCEPSIEPTAQPPYSANITNSNILFTTAGRSTGIYHVLVLQ